MAKYKEVYEKQLELSKLADRSAPISKSAFVGFTFRCFPFFDNRKLTIGIQRGLSRRKGRGGDNDREEEQMERLEQCFNRCCASWIHVILLMDAYGVISIALSYILVISAQCIQLYIQKMYHVQC